MQGAGIPETLSDSHRISITERHTGEPLGSVATLTAHGFVVSMSRRIETGTVLELSLRLSGHPRIEPLELGAVALWISRARVSKSYWAAFQIIDISEHSTGTLERLRRLISPQHHEPKRMV